ncbi:unnamed protein product [Adineta ricciae]|uniref:ER membrane protein complex subunit 2 n=1 Tax=Adineta ricciae TaxID=249248 RepID=A0A815MEN4_ADIRI|nr:unnamed protein product [Adineta ricciae]
MIKQKRENGSYFPNNTYFQQQQNIENHRAHDEIVDLWTDVLAKRNLSSLGDEKWLILEQVFKSALHCSKQSIARHCLDQLEKQFKSTSRRVTTLNAMYHESIDDFKSADDIYSNLLDENETDAIVQKRQISLLKEKNQIREAISKLNTYLQLYQADQEAWSELCDLYLSEHEYVKASFCAEELLLINPHNHLNHERYASIRYSQGDYEGAPSYYFSALKINPTNIRALYGIILTSTNLATNNSSSNSRSNENNQGFTEQIQWAREQITQKYLEMLKWSCKINIKHYQIDSNKTTRSIYLYNNILAQELEQKIEQYASMHHRIYELEKQISDTQNELVNEQVEQHLLDQSSSAGVSRKPFVLFF